MTYQELLAKREEYKHLIGKHFNHKILGERFLMYDITAINKGFIDEVGFLNDERYVREMMYKDLELCFVIIDEKNNQQLCNEERFKMIYS